MIAPWLVAIFFVLAGVALGIYLGLELGAYLIATKLKQAVELGKLTQAEVKRLLTVTFR